MAACDAVEEALLVGEWRRKEGRRYESVAVLFHRWRSQPRLARLSRGRVQPAARVGRHSRANTVRAKALALSVRRWNLGVRPKRQRATAQFRCTACGYGISMTGALPTCPMCRKRAWERIPEATLLRHEGEAVNGTMLRLDEAKDFGFILTEEGEADLRASERLPSR